MDTDGMDHTGRLVYLVVDEAWSGDLWVLTCTGHVWIINSAVNDAKLSAVWQEAKIAGSPSQGATTFRAKDGRSAIGDFISTIAEHHAAWGEIRVVGMRWNDAMRKTISDQIPGISWTIKEEAPGFSICRA